jgi:sugar O-acyltransferase (sialic acid O-acetyltransferase NeuD family)
MMDINNTGVKSKVIIIGAGETATLCYEYFSHDSPHEVVAFAVDSNFRNADSLLGLPIIDLAEIDSIFPPSSYRIFIAVGSGKLNRERKNLYNRLKGRGYTCLSYVSSMAFIWHNVKIGENCLILENNVLQPFTCIGNNVTLWSGNHIGHRSIVEDHCFISSHCVISGYFRVGESTFLGVNCTIEDEVHIEKDNFIGAGALVRKGTNTAAVLQCESTPIARANSHRLFRLRNEDVA